MTGAYMRVKRGAKYENIEVEHLTDEERKEKFLSDPERMIAFFNCVCNKLSEVETKYFVKAKE